MFDRIVFSTLFDKILVLLPKKFINIWQKFGKKKPLTELSISG